ncbi:hypothetical protein D3C86_1559620 [compost metagenome]
MVTVEVVKVLMANLPLAVSVVSVAASGVQRRKLRAKPCVVWVTTSAGLTRRSVVSVQVLLSWASAQLSFRSPLSVVSVEPTSMCRVKLNLP